ncbi:MAG: hypothetical protein L6Q97_27855, partial [Thermoanaerobaculia bacterium]|nr:hypothetical protein [Thermoanaerobaculia bacterium]
KETSQLAKRHFPMPVKDVVSMPLSHDSADEVSQVNMPEWWKGKDDAVPGKTMPKMTVITRDYTNLYNQYISFGPVARDKGLGAHGTHFDCADTYDNWVKDAKRPT